MDAAPRTDGEPIDSEPRIKALQSTLGGINLQNIATLDALMTHFTRLIDLTSADDSYVQQLAQTLAPCILRARTENSLTMEERHPYRLVRDLFEHKDVIFGELKRQSSLTARQSSVSNRQRAISSADESQRRQAMEARARAINQERQRAKSPVPTNRHRRDKSTDGSLGRFPVVASPRQPDHNRNVSGSHNKRSSLDVPGDHDTSPPSNRTTDTLEVNENPRESLLPGNGHITPDISGMPGGFGGGPGPHIPPPLDDDIYAAPMPSEQDVKTAPLKRTSMGVPGRRNFSGAGSLKTKGSLGGLEETERTLTDSPVHSGVQLTDKAMDDFS